MKRTISKISRRRRYGRKGGRIGPPLPPGFKRKNKMTMTIKKVVNEFIETKVLCNSYQMDVKSYITEASTQLKNPVTPTNVQIMASWPIQGDGADQRDGKLIKDVILHAKIKLIFYAWQDVATPAATDQIMHTCIRMIVFTTTELITHGTAIQDFFRIQSGFNDIDLIPVNRAKITVLKDKVYKYTNPTYNSAQVPPVRNTMFCDQAVRYITFKRRWKSLSFPADNANQPSRTTARTYIAILPVSLTGTAATVADFRMMTKLYYKD